MTSYAKPTADLISKTLSRLGSPAHEEYFLSRLENPQWIAVFQERGFLSNPPEPITDGKTTRFPRWPMSMYLARMAAKDPDAVLSAYLRIETKNLSIIHDMSRAARSMLPAQAARLVAKIMSCFEAAGYAAEYADLLEVANSLTENGQEETSLKLFTFLFRPKGDDRRLSDYRHYFAKANERLIPLLARNRPDAISEILSRWIIEAIQGKSYIKENDPYDFSPMWRPAIEEHDQNSDYTQMSLHVGALRNVYENAIDAAKSSLDECLAKLAARPFSIFQRMRVHLINHYADRIRDNAVSLMMDKSRITDLVYKHEHAMLMGNRWDMLTTEQQATWLSWIHEGPSMAGYEDEFHSRMGRHATETDRTNRIKYWIFEKLHWIREHLNGRDKEFYNTMLNEHGEPELSDLSTRTDPARWGSDSPISIEALAGKTLAEALATIDAILSRPLPRGIHSYDGIRDVFRAYLKTQFPPMPEAITLLRSSRWDLIWEFLEVCSGHVKDGTANAIILEILDLGLEVARRPHQPLSDRDSRSTDYQQRARTTLCQIIESLSYIENGSAKFSYQIYGSKMEELIELLHKDRGPSGIIREQERNPIFHDSLDEAINSPSGRAVQALLEYGRWVIFHHKEQAQTDDGSIPGGIASADQLRPMLEWHLVEENRNSYALAVIGTRLNLLVWADAAWSTASANSLFGFERETDLSIPSHVNWSAWNSFLVWVPPNVACYQAFRQQYRAAVERSIVCGPPPAGERRNPMHRLGEHLVLLYGRGDISLDQDEGLFKRFILTAERSVRTHAIAFIGTTLDAKEDIPPEILDRLQRLWEMYWAGPGPEDAASEDGKGLFGEWFSSGQFEAEWSLNTLHNYVKRAKSPEPDHEIVEHLRQLAASHSARVVEILGLLIDGDESGWRIQSWMGDATEILRACLAQPGAVSEVARGIVNRLGRRGFTGLGEVLRPRG